MKLTDEIVARKLGWESLSRKGAKDYLLVYWQRHRGSVGIKDRPVPGGGYDEHYGPPPFTTSLDSIVAEIKARGLMYSVSEGTVSARAEVSIPSGKKIGFCQTFYGDGKTAPLALCAALLDYLRAESKSGRKA